ncbi:MAG TPA: hypothetical protein VJ521_12980, partial [Acidobacteriota bacterium]|nr:hypothetical protein [Acidobacteriota bacterium]
INSVISFVYYGGVVRRMFLEDSPNQEVIRLPGLSKVLLAVLGIAILSLGIYWTPFADFSKRSVVMISERSSIARK